MPRLALQALTPDDVTALLQSNARARTPRVQWLSPEGWQDTSVPTGSASGSFTGNKKQRRRYLQDHDCQVLAYKTT